MIAYPHGPPQAQNLQRKGIEHYQYSLSDVIGRGFSSTVYRGTNEITGENVAIKVVEQRSLQEQVQNMVLTNEIETLKKLESENILKLLDVFTTINNTYIITEYCDQGDMGSQLKSNGALKEEQAVKVLMHVINGLKELQRHGIAHRDLKPDNILIRDGVPKIADFGFAKSIQQITQNKAKEFNVGTPLYMSPETLTKNEYSDKTDIWALGVMFYELVFGSIPWKANTEPELLQQIFANHIPFPVPVSANARDLILRMITIDPKARISLNEIISHPLVRQHNPQHGVRTSPTLEAMRAKTPKQEHVTLPDKKEHIQIVTEYTPKEQNLRNPQSPSQTRDYSNVWVAKCERILMTYIDLCRFLRKVYISLDTPQLFVSPYINSKLRFCAVKNIMIVLTKVKEQTDDDSGAKNPLKLQAWKSFVETPQFQRIRNIACEMYVQNEKLFSAVFEELSSNTDFLSELNFDKNFDTIFDRNFFQYPAFYIIIFQILKDGVKELNHNLIVRYKPEQIPRDCGTHLTTLDNLLSYFQIVRLLRKTLFDPYQFVEESKLEHILEPSPHVVSQRELTQLRQKIKVVVHHQ